MALEPFVIGIRETASWPHSESVRWRLENRSANGLLVGSMVLESAGRIALGDEWFASFRPARARTACVGPLERRWRYFLSWRRCQVRRTRVGLSMTSADSQALDIYYQQPRPVSLVTVPHTNGFNIFPMDLIGSIDANRLFFALRTSSPSVPLMRQRCGVAFSAVPADLKQSIYKLGNHHKAAYAPGAPLPFPTVRSAHLGLEVPAPAFHVSEWMIIDSAVVGSHACFVAKHVGSTTLGSGTQLAHVSALFAHSTRWAAPPVVTV